MADITYIPTWAGFLFLAVVLDAWSRRVVGWAMGTTLKSDLVLDALNMALEQRPNGVIHHSDQGSQYTSIAFGLRCGEMGVRPSMGSVGDAYDNALAETTIGLFKTEVIARRGPWRTLTQVEAALAEWVDWYNHRRLHEACGDIPPVEYEQHHHQRRDPEGPAA